MSTEALSYTDFDDPPEAALRVVDDGLERHNHGVAPLSEVRSLASFASSASCLLRQFEQRAASRGCDVFYLTTLSFQAPEFYRKRGYASIAEISGYPSGITKYLMYKEAPGPSPKSTGTRRPGSGRPVRSPDDNPGT